MTGSNTVEAAGATAHHAHRRVLAREALASALYVALVLLAALIAVPSDRLPPDVDMVWLILGTAVGLLLAHWLAFRLAARITTEQGAGHRPPRRRPPRNSPVAWQSRCWPPRRSSYWTAPLPGQPPWRHWPRSLHLRGA